jgi:uncharacterized membrane protein YbhN (UPF0104 family)
MVSIAMFVLAIWVLHRWMSHVSLHQLGTKLERITLRPILLAILATALSFVALCGYELYAVRFIGRRLAFPVVALYSFVTQSIAHSVGFAILVGATIRYKLYAPRGFSLFEVAKIQVFFTTTFGLGALSLWSIVLLIEPSTLSATLSIPQAWLRALGCLLVAVVLAFLVWGAWFHHPIRLGGQVIVLPGARITIIQILLGIADLCAVAAALDALMPPDLGLGYPELLGIFVAATTLGLLSHVPGSLGVFESTVLLLISPDDQQTVAVIGALIAFRAIYYMLPLLVGALVFGVIELRRWFRQRRAVGDTG